jgi:hypothetical protein
MRAYLINPLVISINHHLSGLFAITVFCILLLMAGVGISSDPNSYVSSYSSGSAADGNNVAEDSNGPTVALDFSKDAFEKNPVSSFMYFIPLVSPTLVDRETSVNNEQQVGFVSYKRKLDSKRFYVSCEFQILGKGFHKNTFDPEGMIAKHIGDLEEEEEPLTNILDYIKLEGEGFGRIDVKGTITSSTKTVTEVDMHFNARGQKSPVTVGLYDIKPKDGEYKYENRSNEVVARVNTLTFKKSEKSTRMGITVASINKGTEFDSLWGNIKAVIANLLIKPPKVDKLGNETMLNFGYALLTKKPAFTFPKAKNIKEDRTVVINNKQNSN